MYVNLSKKFMIKNLLPHLSQSNLGRKKKVPLWRIVKAIIYRLKTGLSMERAAGLSFLQ